MPSIDVLMNTRQAQREAKDVSKALDGMADSMDDFGRDTERAGDKVERTFRDMVQASAKTSREVEGDAKSAARAVEREYDGLGDGGAKGFGKLRDGASEVTQEIGQNLGEAVSSVRDNIGDLGQVGQDTLGGLAGTLAGAGPAGIAGAAALAAGAVGLGLVTAELEKQQEQADRLRDRLAGAYQDAAAEGRDFLDTAQLVAEAQDLMFNSDRADEWKQVQADALKLGMDTADIIRANAGDLDAQAAVQDRINALVEENNRKRGEGSSLASHLKNAANADLEEKALQKLSDRWSDINQQTAENAEKARVARDVVSDYYLSAVERAGVAASAVDTFGNKLYELPDGQQVVVSADTKKATDDITAFKGDVAAATQAQSVAIKVNVDDSEWRNWKPGDKVGRVRTAVSPGNGGGTTWF